MDAATGCIVQQDGLLADADVRFIFSCQVKQRDSGAAQRQHGQGAVYRGKVPIPRPSAGPRVLRSRDKRGLCTFWGHAAALHQVTLPVGSPRVPFLCYIDKTLMCCFFFLIIYLFIYFTTSSRIINKHTDESLGDCSFLNTCFHMDTCKYVHYEIDSPPEAESSLLGPQSGSTELGLRAGDGDSNVGKLFPSQVGEKQGRTRAEREVVGEVDGCFSLQWICCDIRYLDVSILGKFAVVMADPPWDIHMELPYGTLTDDEMRKLNIPILQDDGFIFLWVTGR